MAKQDGAGAVEPFPFYGEDQEPAPPSSRLCVKNIPKHLKDDRLREHFAARGEVTDVKILKTGDGKSRQMAFIGYKTEEDATAALEYFNNTFVDTSRIAVEYARAVKSSALPRPWSRYSEGSSAHKKAHAPAEDESKKEAALDPDRFIGVRELKKMKKAKKHAMEKEMDDMIAADPKLKEFMSLMAPRLKQKIWDNQDVTAFGAEGRGADDTFGDGGGGGADERVEFDDDGSDDDEYQDIFDDSGSEEEDDDGGLKKANKEKKKKSKKSLTEASEEGKHARGGKKHAKGKGGKRGGDSEDDEESSSGEEEDSDGLDDEGDGDDDDDEEDDDDVSGSEMDDDDDDEESDEDPDDVAVDENVSDMDYLKKRAKVSSFSDSEDEEDEEEEGDSEDESMEDDSDEEEDSDKEDDDSDSESSDEESSSDEDGDEKAKAGADAATPNNDIKPKVEEVTADDMEAVAETGRVFVRNLPFTATEEEVAGHFAKFGALTAVHILVDRATRRSKGLAYITYALPENGMKAMDELDGTIFQGRLIHLLPAKRPPNADATLGGVGRAGMDGEGGGDGDDDDGGGSGGANKKPQSEAEREAGFKAARDARLKADAGTNRAAWNSLFMRQDTVAAAVAAKYGVSKADLLESGAEDVAVRMALGEAQVIAETKEQLSQAGVDPTTLEAAAAAGGANVGKGRPGVKRSATAILLKNLPYESEEGDLRVMCERFGAVARLVLPDTRTLAVVEWLEATDARKAFKGLAYKRYKHVPIYVEWAPEGVFTGDAPPAGASGRGGAVGASGSGVTPRVDGGGRGAAAAAAREAAAAGAGLGGGIDGDGGGDEDATQLFVKGLSFQTSEAALRAHFLRAASAAGGRVLSASVATQRGPGGANLSRGFGFVEFDSPDTARSVRRAMQGKDLDGRSLKLEVSSQGGGKGGGGDGDGGDKSTKVPKGFSATKIVVRNVAFEATKRDIQKLFNPFGTLKSCRLPKKFDGNHRGFAFVELSTKREASAALEALRGTHLYGRRVTIERAEDGDDVATIREKTAAHFDAGSAGAQAAAGEPIAKRRKQQR